MYLLKNFLVSIIAVVLIGCGETERPEDIITSPITKPIDKTPKTPTPNFNADSAYSFIQKQVDFGYRIPNTPEHDSCAVWMKRKLTEYGFTLTIQTGKVKAWTGNILNIENIIAQYNPEATNRIMLCAHWDTRPYADRGDGNKTKPIPGANDGGSGVGVLLEIARQISVSDPKTGVDLIFFDAEDYGAMSTNDVISDLSTMSDSWCLGSQYWSKNPPIKNYKPRYGILLDMVGAKDATFPKESLSQQYAGAHVQRIWKEAEVLGYGKYFVKKIAPAITDDHTYINQIAGIPTLDIIHYEPNVNAYNGFDFGHFHHTQKDNMGIIHKETLKAVGQTVIHIVYQKI
jgi:glutaminyl-peptide cyclotransferase